MNTGAPSTPRTTPTWSSPGAITTRPTMSASEQHDRREHEAVGEDPAVIRAAQHAGEVRDHQADERDRSARGGRRAAQDGDRHEQDEPGPLDSLAKSDRHVLPECQPVERPAAGERDDDARSDERHGLPEDRHVSAGQRSHLPEPQLVEGFDIGQRDRRGDRDEAGGDGGPSERQLDRRCALTSQRGEPVDEDGRHSRTQERQPDGGPRRRRPEDRDAKDDAGGCTGVDAHDPGIGERVPRDALEDHTAEPERRAGRQTEQCARDAHLGDDGLGRR